MKYERDAEWPYKLQPAVFSTNTQFKRATGSTVFRLMFGKDCDHFPLLMLITGAPEDTRNNQDSLSDDEITVHIYVHIF